MNTPPDLVEVISKHQPLLLAWTSDGFLVRCRCGHVVRPAAGMDDPITDTDREAYVNHVAGKVTAAGFRKLGR